MISKGHLVTLLALIAMLVAGLWSIRAGDELGLATRMYSSQRAAEIGDLLTVVVDEATSSAKSENLATNRGVSHGGNVQIGSPTGGSLSRSLDRRVDVPAVNIDLESEFSGGGSTTSEEALSTRFTVRVVDRLDNGLLLVRGNRKIKMRGEETTMVLTGLVRRRDVENDNTVLSSRMSDAIIRYETSGNVAREARPGWMWKIFRTIYPF